MGSSTVSKPSKHAQAYMGLEEGIERSIYTEKNTQTRVGSPMIKFFCRTLEGLRFES